MRRSGGRRRGRRCALRAGPPGEAGEGQHPAIRYATLEELGHGGLRVIPTSDVPVTVGGFARFVASVGSCSSGPGCRAVIVHDLVSYQPITETPLPQQGGWGLSF